MSKQISTASHSPDSRKPRRGLARDDRGLSTVEYIIILMLIAVAGIALWSAFGETVSGKIGEATGEVGSL
jgi:Flp pilus assembly pilin Flp